MANVNARISLGVYDANGARSNFLAHANVVDTTTLAGAVTAASALATAFKTVSSAGIKDTTISIISSADNRAPQTDADMGSGAVFDFDNATDPTIYGLWVPSFLDSLLGPGRAIDITDTVQAAFVASMVAAVAGGHYTNAHYVTLRAATKAFRTKRKLR
jgi:hypothetical protein